MDEITFLEKDQIEGKNKLEIIRQYGFKCNATDFAALQGCVGLKGKDSYYWTKNIIDEEHGYFVFGDSILKQAFVWNYVGSRPVLTNCFELINFNEIDKNSIVKYGEFPQ